MTAQRRINVLHLCEHFGGRESRLHGVARTFQWWLPRLDANRFRVLLCSRRGHDRAAVQMIQCGLQPLYLGYGKLDPRNLRSLLRILKREQIDILHIHHGYGACTWGRIAGRLLHIPVIVHGRGNYGSVPLLQRPVEWLLGPSTLYAFAVSQSTKDFLTRKRHIPADRIQVLYNGIPLEEIRTTTPEWMAQFRREHGVEPEDKLIGIVGRMEIFKGHLDSFRALQIVQKQIPRVFLWVIGDGMYEPELKRWVVRHRLDDSIRFLGFRRDVREVIQCLDVQLFPSHREGTPNTLYEALAVGNAILAARTDGQAEILEDRQTALMFDAGDSEAIAALTLKVFQDPGLAAALRAAARIRSRDFDGLAGIRTMEALYTQIMAREEDSSF